MKKFYLIIVALFFLSTTVANAIVGYVKISINSFGEADLKGKTFIVEPLDNNISKSDFEFKEYAGWVSRAFATKGAVPVTSDYPNLDYVVFIEYGISQQSKEISTVRPVWGKTGANVNTTSTTNATGNAYGYGSAYSSGNSVSAYGNVNANASSTTNTSTSVNYNYGVTGYTTGTRTRTEYYRSLSIHMYDAKDSEFPMAFKMMVESEGPSDDLRGIVPMLACASTIYLGKSSKEKVKGYIEYDGNPNNLREYDVFKEIPLPRKMYLSETKKSVNDYLTFVYAADSSEGTYILMQFGENLMKPLLKYVAIEQDGQKIVPHQILVNPSNWALLKVDFDPTKEFRIVEYRNKSMTSRKISIDKITLRDYTVIE